MYLKETESYYKVYQSLMLKWKQSPRVYLALYTTLIEPNRNAWHASYIRLTNILAPLIPPTPEKNEEAL